MLQVVSLSGYGGTLLTISSTMLLSTCEHVWLPVADLHRECEVLPGLVRYCCVETS